MQALGLRAYLGLFSLLSALGLAAMILALVRAPHVHLWSQPRWLHWIAALLVLPGIVLAVLGLTTPNPTLVGSDELLSGSQEPARGVLRITRHPFLIGVVLWGVAHLLTSGHAAAALFFGSLTALALLGPASIDRRKRRLGVVGFEAFAAATSIVPFAALASGRNHLDLREIGTARSALGVLAFAALLAAHPWLFGVAPLAF